MADIICRWRNGTPKTVMELANSLPHSVMPVSEFRKKMSNKWNGEFFHSPYQLACQLALYCEAEDGNYYPRFDHDINEAEAHRYLELWISRYYIPNPHVANDGFKDLECPTYILKALYDYVQTHPGCDYETAYKECFHDYAKNNDDIVRNYINRFSKILSFSKDGKLSTTDYNANKYFSFMDRNNKKEFFDTFNTQDQPSLMDTFLSKDIDQKKQMFYEYLRSTGLADSSCKQYAFTHPFHEEVIQIIQENANKNCLFDVIDGWMVKKIHKLVCQLDGNKKQGNAWSAAISNYKNFLDYLEVGVVDTNGVSEHETPHLNVSNGKLIKESTNIVEFFAFAVKTLLNYDPDFSKAQGEFKYNQVTVGFKYCPFGKKTEGLENITDPRRSNDCDTSITWNLGDTEYCFLKEQSSNSLKTFADNINQIYSEKYRIDIDGNQYKMYELADDAVIVENPDDCDNMDTTPVNFIYSAQQTIYYGAPGTGKSHTIDGMVTDENSIRTTFHPDSDYSTFVGAYKPKMDGEKIVYKFQPQAFLKAYCKAWKNSEESIYLVIEEINRGNCAQIFGDLFQLLDRCNNGYSSYAIEPDSDITDFLMTDKEYSLKGLVLTEDITNDNGKVIASAESVKMGKKLVLPPNMSILCTMNTSDQSLFPMDSAFKRRWQWRYTPIEQPKAGEAGEPRKWKIKADGRWCYWWEFLQAINEVIEEVNHSEDKQLGYFFAKPDDGDYIDAKTFVNKVVFYLWNDIFKDEECDIFKYNPIKLANEDEIKIDGTKEDTELTFRRFIKNSEEVREDVVRWFIDNILKEKEILMLDDVKQEPVADKVAYMREITELSSDSSLSDDKDTTINSNLENKCKIEYKPLVEAIVRKLGKREYKFYDNGFDTNISDMPISYTKIATTMAKGQNGYAEVKLYNEAQSSNKYAKDLFDYLIGKDAKTTIENMANEQNVEFCIINEDAATKVTGWALKMSIDFNSLNVEEVSDKLYAIIDCLLKVSEPWIDEFRASHK